MGLLFSQNNDIAIKVDIGEKDCVEMTLSEIRKEIQQFIKKCPIDDTKPDQHKMSYDYKGFKYDIYFHDNSHFCGYVTDFGKYEDRREFCDNNEDEIYCLHSEFSIYHGFDCAHFGDIFCINTDDPHLYEHLIKSAKSVDSFKSEKFVSNELKKTIDSIINFCERQ